MLLRVSIRLYFVSEPTKGMGSSCFLTLMNPIHLTLMQMLAPKRFLPREDGSVPRRVVHNAPSPRLRHTSQGSARTVCTGENRRPRVFTSRLCLCPLYRLLVIRSVSTKSRLVETQKHNTSREHVPYSLVLSCNHPNSHRTAFGSKLYW